MLALSIRQPWAWAILHAGKDIENRFWPTDYRGPLLIHTGRDVHRPAWEWMLRTRGITVPPQEELPRSGIVGIVDLVDCVIASDSPWFTGPYGFVLRNARQLPFRGAFGNLRIFEVEDIPI